MGGIVCTRCVFMEEGRKDGRWLVVFYVFLWNGTWNFGLDISLNSRSPSTRIKSTNELQPCLSITSYNPLSSATIRLKYLEALNQEIKHWYLSWSWHQFKHNTFIKRGALGGPAGARIAPSTSFISPWSSWVNSPHPTWTNFHHHLYNGFKISPYHSYSFYVGR